MAATADTTVNHTVQARTCAELAEAFHDADDAYLEAVAGGIMDRQTVIDARSDALVAFLTGPRPVTTTDAHSVMFAAMQAVVDGNDFDPAWRENVSTALVLLGARGSEDAPATEADYAAATFEPLSPETLEGMNARLHPDSWNIGQRQLRQTLALAFALLGKSKADLVALASTEGGIAALEEVTKDFDHSATWLRSAVSFLDTIKVRMMVAEAAANRAAKVRS